VAVDNKPSDAGMKWPAGDVAWMLAVFCLGLLVRLFRIDHQPFWLDEALTSQRIQLGPSGLIADSFTNRHMPTYFLMLRLISQFGSGNALLRIPSALFGALSVGMVFVMARRISTRGAAVVAGLLMALSPLEVQYGQEARSYTLVTLLITIALWGLLRLAQNPHTAALDVRRIDADRLGWVAYVAGTIGALDVLGDAAPWLIASNLALFLIWRTLHQGASPEVRDSFRRNACLSMAVIVACTVPFYGAILAFGDRHILQNFDWIPQLSWQHLWVAASSVYLMRTTAVVRFDLLHTAVPLLGALVAVLAHAPAIGGAHPAARLRGAAAVDPVDLAVQIHAVATLHFVERGTVFRAGRHRCRGVAASDLAGDGQHPAPAWRDQPWAGLPGGNQAALGHGRRHVGRECTTGRYRFDGGPQRADHAHRFAAERRHAD
jgi:mannosyltransferase